MTETWTLEKIKQLFSNQVQEHLKLEYKSAGALDKTPEKKKEITKDVSAMANSDGGTIIYGIKEYDEEDKRYLPEKINAIDQSKITKEWLEQVINTIRPKVEGVIITPVSVEDGKNAIYVVEIPKGDTAYQAQDFRYYKRYNFLATPMEDYEIRDIMGRNKNPKFELSFLFEVESSKYTLIINAKNIGLVYANYVNAYFYIPYYILEVDYIEEGNFFLEDGIKYYRYYEDNTVREIVDFRNLSPRYGPARYAPILPGLSRRWEISLKNFSDILPRGHFDTHEKINWTIHADNAIPISGEKYIVEIDIKIKEPAHA